MVKVITIDTDGTITLRGYYHIYKEQYDTPEKAKSLIAHLNGKTWFIGLIKQQTIKAIGEIE